MSGTDTAESPPQQPQQQQQAVCHNISNSDSSHSTLQDSSVISTGRQKCDFAESSAIRPLRPKCVVGESSAASSSRRRKCSQDEPSEESDEDISDIFERSVRAREKARQLREDPSVRSLAATEQRRPMTLNLSTQNHENIRQGVST